MYTDTTQNIQKVQVINSQILLLYQKEASSLLAGSTGSKECDCSTLNKTDRAFVQSPFRVFGTCHPFKKFLDTSKGFGKCSILQRIRLQYLDFTLGVRNSDVRRESKGRIWYRANWKICKTEEWLGGKPCVEVFWTCRTIVVTPFVFYTGLISLHRVWVTLL